VVTQFWTVLFFFAVVLIVKRAGIECGSRDPSDFIVTGETKIDSFRARYVRGHIKGMHILLFMGEAWKDIISDS